ncbi:MAG: hypothetical protein ACI4UU_04825 [Clostridia bacterium]
MNDEDLKLFGKGNYKDVDQSFMEEGKTVLQELQRVQEKYDKLDTDTFINELRDSIAGYTLGFNLVNIEKHGFDCKKDSKNLYLEVKSASFSSESWQATFNDTTLEKAEAFKDKKVFLALAVWKGASDLLFICYGQNKKIGEYLEHKVKWFKLGKTVRSTQSIAISKLVFDYGFNILAVNRTKREVLNLLKAKNSKFKKLNEDDIISIEEYNGLKAKDVMKC